MRHTHKVQPFSREWIVSFKDPRHLWTENWFALVLEVVSAIILFQIFRNAKRSNPQTAYLVLTVVFTVIFFEVLPILPRPGYQLWWYHQGLVNVLKQRIPSYVITVSTLVHYIAHNLTNNSNLPGLTRSLVTAICGSLIMFPCLWLAPRLLLIVFHLDDPIFSDRLAGVPFIQILVVFLIFFHTGHLFQQYYDEIEPQERNTFSYVKCAVQSSLISAMYTYLEQYLLYIFLNLTCRLHTAVCLAAAVIILLYLAKDELKQMQMTSYSIQGIITPLLRKELWFVVAALIFTSTLPVWLNTSNLKSSSDRLEIGPCQVMHEVANTSPLEIMRRRYICPDDTNQLNFDFHCVSKNELTTAMNNKTKHYVTCGKDFEKPLETTKLLALYSIFCLSICYATMLFSFTFKVQVKKVDDCKKIE